MQVCDFHFDLPEELIAQTPPEVRGASRMLRMERSSGRFEDDVFANLPRHLRAGDLLVLNDSRVLPARLYARRAGLRTRDGSPDPTGRIEVLLTEDLSGEHGGDPMWRALVRPGRKVQRGERLLFFADEMAEPALTAEVVGTGDFGERLLRFGAVANLLEVVERIGHMPLPPYIQRAWGEADRPADRERYQTVYARGREAKEHRSAAAPTAGLHFTPATLEEVRARGVVVEFVSLHVGLGTFQPVRVDEVEQVRLHAELYTLPERTANALNLARAERRRIVAVGTTTTRTLEHCALMAERAGGRELQAHSGSTSIFLRPGSEFRLVTGLLTNFHLSESTLLMLVSAFAGREAVMRAYAHAVEARYRFFSYGDCMLIT